MVAHPATDAADELIMWAASGDGLNMRVLWTDTPYAMQRVAWLFDAGEITTEEGDDLAHFVEHGWLLWRGAVAPELIDAFVEVSGVIIGIPANS